MAFEGDEGRAGGWKFDDRGAVLYCECLFPHGRPLAARSHGCSAQGCVGGIVHTRRMQTKRGHPPALLSSIDRETNSAIQILVESRHFDCSCVAAESIRRQQRSMFLRFELAFH